MGFVTCKPAAIVQHRQLGRAVGKGRPPMLSPDWWQSSCHHPWGYVGLWCLPCLPLSPGTPEKNLVPSKTSATEVGAILFRGKAEE